MRRAGIKDSINEVCDQERAELHKYIEETRARWTKDGILDPIGQHAIFMAEGRSLEIDVLKRRIFAKLGIDQ